MNSIQEIFISNLNLLIFNSNLNINDINDIDIFSNSYEISFMFQNFETILKIMLDEERNISIFILNPLSEPHPCLYIKFIQKDDNIIESIEYVYARSDKCLIPKIGGGTWILQLTELDDLSQIKC